MTSEYTGVPLRYSGAVSSNPKFGRSKLWRQMRKSRRVPLIMPGSVTFTLGLTDVPLSVGRIRRLGAPDGDPPPPTHKRAGLGRAVDESTWRATGRPLGAAVGLRLGRLVGFMVVVICAMGAVVGVAVCPFMPFLARGRVSVSWWSRALLLP